MGMLVWESFSLECEECLDQYDGSDEQTREGVAAEARLEGWLCRRQSDLFQGKRIETDDDVWQTWCPDCKEKAPPPEEGDDDGDGTGS